MRSPAIATGTRPNARAIGCTNCFLTFARGWRVSSRASHRRSAAREPIVGPRRAGGARDARLLVLVPALLLGACFGRAGRSRDEGGTGDDEREGGGPQDPLEGVIAETLAVDDDPADDGREVGGDARRRDDGHRVADLQAARRREKRADGRD